MRMPACTIGAWKAGEASMRAAGRGMVVVLEIRRTRNLIIDQPAGAHRAGSECADHVEGDCRSGCGRCQQAEVLGEKRG